MKQQKRFNKKIQVAGPMNLPVLLNEKRPSQFKLYIFRLPDSDYYVVEKGDVRGNDPVLVRVHSACNIAHIFHSERCDCEAQLQLAMKLIDKSKNGLLIYIVNQEGRGVGPFDHIRVYQEQDKGFDTVDSYLNLHLPVDKRDYSGVKPILKWFNIKRIDLLTNNPKKIESLKKLGFLVKRKPLIPKLTRFNQSQIKAKIEKFGHLMPYPKK